MLSLSRKAFCPMTIKELKSVPITPRGDRTDRWQGVNHGELAEGVIHTMGELFEVKPINPEFYISPNQAICVGHFGLGRDEILRDKKGRKRGTELRPIELLPGITAELGFRHGNDSSRALEIYPGGMVKVCTNGLVLITGVGGWTHPDRALMDEIAKVTPRRRHTKNLHLGDWLKEELSEFLPTLEAITGRQLAPLHESKIDPKQHEHGMIELARKDIIPWKYAGNMDELWTKAVKGESIGWVSEGYAPEDWGFDGTKWDWYGCCTHVIKMRSPVQQFRALQGALSLALSL